MKEQLVRTKKKLIRKIKIVKAERRTLKLDIRLIGKYYQKVIVCGLVKACNHIL